MEVALRSIEHREQESVVTHAYSAQVFIDDAYFCDVSNDGAGGTDCFTPPRAAKSGFEDKLVRIDEEIAKAFPALDLSRYGISDVPRALSDVCYTLFTRHLENPTLKPILEIQ